MERKKIVILPQLYNYGGDITKKWFVFYSYRDPRNNKMKRFKVYGKLHVIKEYNLRIQAAENLRVELTQKLKSGWNPFLDDEKVIYEDQLQYNNIARIYGKARSENKTVRLFSSKFLSSLREGDSIVNETISTYTSKFRVFNQWLDKNGFAQDDIMCIKNDVILQFFHFLINQEKLSAYTIKRYRQLLSRMFDYAKQEKAIIENPVFNIPKTKRINDQSPRPIAEFDILSFKTSIMEEDPQLWLAISFEYYCFLRPGKELRFLKIRDIDFARGVVDVDSFRSKTNLERFPTIPLVFLNELRNNYQLHKYPREYYVLGKGGLPGLEHLSKNTLRNRFRAFREKLNMPDTYKFYSWKHTGNGRASDNGISMRALQDQNGHTSIKTTEIYMRHKIGRVSEEIRNKFPEL